MNPRPDPPIYTMRLRLHEQINIVVTGVVRDFGSKDQSKMQTQTQCKRAFTVLQLGRIDTQASKL